MYNSAFSTDIEKMLAHLHSSGIKAIFIDYFLHDFDDFCVKRFPNANILSQEIANSWIHNTHSKSLSHYSRRILTMRHLGKYQQSIGKKAYIPKPGISYRTTTEPHLFSDEQLKQFFEGVDTKVRNTKMYPNNSIVFPTALRMQYCCGMRSSEVCNLKVKDVDLIEGTVCIYHSKGSLDRKIYMSEDLRKLCHAFDVYYSSIIPNRLYFFQPSDQIPFYTSNVIHRFFIMILKSTGLIDVGGKRFTPHGLRHLFAVQNIKKCLESNENFANWIEYLCRYMGHSSIESTLYYIHLTSQLFPIYQDKLKQLEKGIGMKYVEEE